MLMLQGYFDESGSEGQDSVVVLAGFVSTGEKWTRFSDEWSRLLTPRRPVFKMREEANRKPISARNDRIAAFADIIQRNILYKIECSVSVSAFQSVIKGRFFPSNRHARILDDYYVWVFNNLVARLCEGIWYRGYRHPFDIFFDEQLKHGPRARKLYKIACDLTKPRYRRVLPTEPIFRNDNDFRPLQAADMFAWLTRKKYNGEDMSQWEWLLAKLNMVEAIASSFLDENRLAYLMGDSGHQFDERTLERWSRLLEESQ
jgi:hypothetical protein